MLSMVRGINGNHLRQRLYNQSESMLINGKCFVIVNQSESMLISNTMPMNGDIVIYLWGNW